MPNLRRMTLVFQQVATIEGADDDVILTLHFMDGGQDMAIIPDGDMVATLHTSMMVDIMTTMPILIIRIRATLLQNMIIAQSATIRHRKIPTKMEKSMEMMIGCVAMKICFR